eukprot:UC4_evm3s665
MPEISAPTSSSAVSKSPTSVAPSPVVIVGGVIDRAATQAQAQHAQAQAQAQPQPPHSHIPSSSAPSPSEPPTPQIHKERSEIDDCPAHAASSAAGAEVGATPPAHSGTKPPSSAANPNKNPTTPASGFVSYSYQHAPAPHWISTGPVRHFAPSQPHQSLSLSPSPSPSPYGGSPSQAQVESPPMYHRQYYNHQNPYSPTSSPLIATSQPHIQGQRMLGGGDYFPSRAPSPSSSWYRSSPAGNRDQKSLLRGDADGNFIPRNKPPRNDHNTGKSRQNSHHHTSNRSQKACSTEDGSKLQDQPEESANVSRKAPSVEHAYFNNRVYALNIPEELSMDDLKKLMEARFGTVCACRGLDDNACRQLGLPKNSGYLTFEVGSSHSLAVAAGYLIFKGEKVMIRSASDQRHTLAREPALKHLHRPDSQVVIGLDGVKSLRRSNSAPLAGAAMGLQHGYEYTASIALPNGLMCSPDGTIYAPGPSMMESRPMPTDMHYPYSSSQQPIYTYTNQPQSMYPVPPQFNIKPNPLPEGSSVPVPDIPMPEEIKDSQGNVYVRQDEPTTSAPTTVMTGAMPYPLSALNSSANAAGVQKRSAARPVMAGVPGFLSHQTDIYSVNPQVRNSSLANHFSPPPMSPPTPPTLGSNRPHPFHSKSAGIPKKPSQIVLYNADYEQPSDEELKDLMVKYTRTRESLEQEFPTRVRTKHKPAKKNTGPNNSKRASKSRNPGGDPKKASHNRQRQSTRSHDRDSDEDSGFSQHEFGDEFYLGIMAEGGI